jgi:hypothetical protein
MQQMSSAAIEEESVLSVQHDIDNNRSRPAVPAINDDTEAVAGAVAQNGDDTMNATSILTRTRPHHHHRYNFVIMSLLFSANHGCVVACLSLATARLGGALGAWQSGLLYV